MTEWAAMAQQVVREVGGDAATLDRAAQHVQRARDQAGAMLRAAGLEGRVAAVSLPALPVAAGVLRQVVDPGFAQRLFTSPAGWMPVVAATALTLIGGLWLWRIAAPPYAARPAKWQRHRERAALVQQLADALDGARLYAIAGLPLEAALERVDNADGHPSRQLLELLRAAQATGTERPSSGAAPPAWVAVLLEGRGRHERPADVLAAASARLRHDWLRTTTARAQRTHVAAILPFAACILPATLIVGLVAWP